MFGKLIKSEESVYAELRENDIQRAIMRVGQKVFNLTFIYALQDKQMAERLLGAQQSIKDILGDGHYYFTEQDLHMTLFIPALRSPLLSTANRQQHREKALDFFINPEARKLFISPTIHFRGGHAGSSVIVHGYSYKELNESRLALVRHGLRYRLFDYKRALNYAKQIVYKGLIYPNIAHINLVRLDREISADQRNAVNNLLAEYDFGQMTFPEVGLYEFPRFGIFSTGKCLDSINP